MELNQPPGIGDQPHPLLNWARGRGGQRGIDQLSALPTNSGIQRLDHSLPRGGQSAQVGEPGVAGQIAGGVLSKECHTRIAGPLRGP